VPVIAATPPAAIPNAAEESPRRTEMTLRPAAGGACLVLIGGDGSIARREG
jgi:hypothetical protein